MGLIKNKIPLLRNNTHTHKTEQSKTSALHGPEIQPDPLTEQCSVLQKNRPLNSCPPRRETFSPSPRCPRGSPRTTCYTRKLNPHHQHKEWHQCIHYLAGSVSLAFSSATSASWEEKGRMAQRADPLLDQRWLLVLATEGIALIYPEKKRISIDHKHAAVSKIGVP